MISESCFFRFIRLERAIREDRVMLTTVAGRHGLEAAVVMAYQGRPASDPLGFLGGPGNVQAGELTEQAAARFQTLCEALTNSNHETFLEETDQPARVRILVRAKNVPQQPPVFVGLLVDPIPA